MPYASVTYTATAGQTQFTPVFSGGPALQSSHIKVYVNGSPVSSTVTGNLASPTVTIAATSSGDKVRIERQTPLTAQNRLVDFEDGDILTASDLDTAMLNTLYVAQEANDVGSRGLPLDPLNDVWDAGNRRIINVNNPSNTTDAANKAYVDSIMLAQNQGTVTSVGLNFPADFNVGNSPITNSGTINVEWAKVDSGNKVFGASLSTGLPEFRLLTAGDIPSLTASKISDFNTQVRTNRLDQMATPTGSVSMGSQLITNLLACQNPTDAANKAYVDVRLNPDPFIVTSTYGGSPASYTNTSSIVTSAGPSGFVRIRVNGHLLPVCRTCIIDGLIGPISGTQDGPHWFSLFNGSGSQTKYQILSASFDWIRNQSASPGSPPQAPESWSFPWEAPPGYSATGNVGPFQSVTLNSSGIFTVNSGADYKFYRNDDNTYWSGTHGTGQATISGGIGPDVSTTTFNGFRIGTYARVVMSIIRLT